MKISSLDKDLELLHSGKKPTLKLLFRNEKSFNEGGEVMTTPSHQQSRFSDMDSLTKKSTSFNGADVSMTFTDKVSMENSKEGAVATLDKKNSNEMKPKKIPSKLSNCLASLTDNESSSSSEKSCESEKSDGDLCPERRKQISFRMSSSFEKNSSRRKSK